MIYSYCEKLSIHPLVRVLLKNVFFPSLSFWLFDNVKVCLSIPPCNNSIFYVYQTIRTSATLVVPKHVARHADELVRFPETVSGVQLILAAAVLRIKQGSCLFAAPACESCG